MLQEGHSEVSLSARRGRSVTVSTTMERKMWDWFEGWGIWGMLVGVAVIYWVYTTYLAAA
jgi:hypothetical protein